MPKHFLNGAQIGAALEHMGREAMAKHMRMQIGDAHRFTRMRHNAMHRLARHARASGIQEHRRRAFALHGKLRTKAVIYIRPQRRLGRSRNRHEALARALAEHAHHPTVEINAAHIEAHEFACTQTAAIQNLEHRLVALRSGTLAERLVEQRIDLVDGKRIGQTIGPLGQRNRFCRVRLHQLI